MDSTQVSPGLPYRPRPESSDQLIRQIGPYRLLRLLGSGGMGQVYLGYDEKADQQVAVKLLADDLALVPHFIERFYREGKVGALLHHPNIIRSIDCGLDPDTGKHYLVLEYIDGLSARTLLQERGRLGVADTVHIALDIARALEHIHARAIVHRDIKPDNLLLSRRGIASLADFGLARRTDEVSHLTVARQVFGTTHYMPYEQAVNARYADGRSDLYALGASLFHLVTGLVPFPGEDHLEIIEMKRLGQLLPPSVHNPEVPPELDAILTTLLARHPRDRYQTASELIVDLERTRLAAGVPSYADAQLASSDPWFLACRSDAMEVTRPNLESAKASLPELEALRPAPPQAPSGGQPDSRWLVLYRRAGRLCKGRVSLAQLVQRIRDGRLPVEAEVCPPGQEGFRPLKAIPELRAHVPPATVTPTRPASEDELVTEPLPGWLRRLFPRAIGLGIAIVVGVLAVVLYHQLGSLF